MMLGGQMPEPARSAADAPESLDFRALTAGTAHDVRRLMSTLRVPCLLVAPTGDIVTASDAVALPAESLAGSSLQAIYSLRDPLRLRDGPTSGIYRRADGERVPVQLVPMFALDGGETLVIVHDGESYRHAECMRFERAPYAVFRVDNAGIVRFANMEAGRMLGRAAADLAGQPLAGHFRPGDEAAILGAIDACASAGDAPLREPVPIATPAPDGVDSLYELILTPDIAPDGTALGVIAVVQSRAVDRVRDQIRRVALDPATPGWRARLVKILDLIRPLVPFDHAIFGVYAQDATLFRAVEALPEGEIPWPARWLLLPPEVKQWLDAGETWIEDARKFISTVMGGRESEVSRCYREHGILASVTLPVVRNGGYSAALSLCSRRAGFYGRAHLEVLRELELEPVLMRFERARDDARRAFAAEMREKVLSASSLRKAGVDIVQRIAEHFAWDYVGLFRVNRQEGRFEIVTQCSLAPAYDMPGDYTQPIDRGMLGASLRERALLTVEQIGAPGCEQHDYIGPERPLRSAMTVPIRLNGRIRWVLDVESSVTHAFLGPDNEDLREIIESLEEGLDQHLLRQTKRSLMSETEQAVVFVGREGAIIEMNRVAADMLGTEPGRCVDGETPMLITAFALPGDVETMALLSTRADVTRERLELRGAGGRAQSVLATRTDLDPSLDMSIWFFTDIAELAWSRDLRFLREAAAEVAEQTRTSLALACSLTAQAAMLHGESGSAATPTDVVSRAKDLSQRIVAEIGKADITFERLASASAARHQLQASHAGVNLAALLRTVTAALPVRDRRRIEVHGEPPPDADLVPGNADALAAVFRSILAYLLGCRTADDARVEVDFEIDSGAGSMSGTAGIGETEGTGEAAGTEGVIVRFGLSAEQPWDTTESVPAVPDDPLVVAERSAHDAAGIAMEQIVRTMEAHGGMVITDPPSLSRSLSYLSILPPWRSFALRFPRREA